MSAYLPEKVRHLDALKNCGFPVPDFIYIPASDFEDKDIEALEAFLQAHRESYKIITRYEKMMEDFALRHERFAVLGLSIRVPDELNQVANHYLDDTPENQQRLSKALHHHLYEIDHFLGEADTIIAKERIHVKLCSHDAYGIDTVRNPIWMAYWRFEKHRETVRHFKQLGFKTGDTVAIEIDAGEKPVVYRL